MIEARKEFYRVYANVLTILIGEFGNYKTEANRQINFQSQSAAARYSVAAKALNSATTRIAELEAERQQLVKSGQEDALTLV